MSNYTIILRTTNHCNLNCTYCYDKENHNNRNVNFNFKENINNLYKYISEIYRNCSGKAEIILHGGEPMLIKPESYIKFFKKLESIKSLKFKYSIQTNGTLITKEFIKFFKDYDVNVGISLDGCNEQENQCRVFLNGKNSFNEVLKSIELLNEKNCNYGVIMTISKNHVNQEKKLYDFIAKYKLKCNIRPAFKTSESDTFVMNEEEYTEFFINLFEIWYNDNKSSVTLTQINELYIKYMEVLNEKFNSRSCSRSLNCFNKFISLDPEGNIYSCNRSYNNREFYLGNLNVNTWEEIKEIASQKNQFRYLKIMNSKCKACEIFEFCRGGCPVNAYNLTKSFYNADTQFCDANKKIYNYIYQKLEKNGDLELYRNHNEKNYR